MSIYNSQVAFKSGTGFNSAQGVAICGLATQPYNNGETAQAKVGTVEPTFLMPCTPVIINNDTTEATGKGVYKGLNEKSLVVSKAAADQNDVVDGFTLIDNCLLNDDDVGGYPITDGTVSVGLIGSGVEIFLPCDDNLIGKPLSTALYWDATNHKLTATTDTNISLPTVKMLSSVVAGKNIEYSGYESVWKDCSAVLVRL